MVTNLHVGDRFPDFTLPNQDNEPVKFSDLTLPSLMDRQLGFTDGYPLIVVFYRGFFVREIGSNYLNSSSFKPNSPLLLRAMYG